jgi:excisionase family DNA binding protein
MPDQTTAELLRVAAVAKRLDVHVSTVYRLVESGALKALRVGKSIRIRAESLDAYLAVCEQAAVAPTSGEVA